MTNEQIDTIWKTRAICCSKELETMGYRVWQYDGDTYNWIFKHKNANGAMSETTLSHKQLVKFTESQRAGKMNEEEVSGSQLIKMAEDLGWRGE